MDKIDLRQQPTAREIIGFGILLLLIFYVFLQLGWSPSRSRVAKTAEELKTLAAEKAAIEKLMSTIEGQVQKRAMTAEKLPQGHIDDDRLQRILSYKPKEQSEEVASFVARLSDQRSLRGMRLKGINVGQAKKQKNFISIPIEAHVEGRYSSILRYLAELEKIETPVLVVGVSIEATESKSSFLVAHFSVELYLPT